jgi:hypothetical protein
MGSRRCRHDRIHQVRRCGTLGIPTAQGASGRSIRSIACGSSKGERDLPAAGRTPAAGERRSWSLVAGKRCRVQASRLVRSTPTGLDHPTGRRHPVKATPSRAALRSVALRSAPALTWAPASGRSAGVEPGGTARGERTCRAAMPREAERGQRLWLSQGGKV